MKTIESFPLEAGRFAGDVGICNIDELQCALQITGDDALGFGRTISQFKSNAPRASVTDLDAYDGDFPTTDFTNATSFEVPEQVADHWPESLLKPEWMNPGDKKHLFDDLLHEGDLRAAWLTLNSSGWRVSAAKDALIRLAQRTQEPGFAEMCSAWLSAADGGLDHCY